MRRVSTVQTLNTVGAIRTFFPEFAAAGICLAKFGGAMLAFVAACDARDAYYAKPEISAHEFFKARGMPGVTRLDCIETSAIPHSVRVREANFNAAAQASLQQIDINEPDKYNFLPLQYVISTDDLDGLFTLARKGLVVTPEAIEMAKKAGCSENFVAALTVLYKIQESRNDQNKSFFVEDVTKTAVVEKEVVPFNKGP